MQATLTIDIGRLRWGNVASNAAETMAHIDTGDRALPDTHGEAAHRRRFMRQLVLGPVAAVRDVLSQVSAAGRDGIPVAPSDVIPKTREMETVSLTRAWTHHAS